MTLDETTYKMAREGKVLAVKIKRGET